MSQLPNILLETRDLAISFGGLKAVDGVSLRLQEGIITTLVGPNGAGKTTLFNLITGQLEPDVGDVQWLGRSIKGQSNWKIAQAGIGRTFQDLKLFNQMTVLENALTVTERRSWLWQSGGRAAAADRLAQLSLPARGASLTNRQRRPPRARRFPAAGAAAAPHVCG